MIQTVALTILMPATIAVPTTPVRLPGPSTPLTAIEGVRLPGPALPIIIDQDIRLPSPAVPAARLQLFAPRPAPAKQPLSAIETLRKLVKDDRPLVIKKAFDNSAL